MRPEVNLEHGGRTPERSFALGGLLLVLGLVITVAGFVTLSHARVDRGPAAVTSDPIADSTSDPIADSAPESPPLSREATTDAAGDSDTAGDSAASASQAPRPVGIRIPTISVDADMIALGLRDDGSIEVPTDFAQTGWWADGPEPGEPGPAVVLGHVDSRSGPAVFFSLSDLVPNDEVIIERADGSSVAYKVDRIEQHPKDRFPTDSVYGDTPDAQLRLVTCGGEFDRSERSYRDNIVVFASLA